MVKRIERLPEEELERMYVNKGKTIKEIAKNLNVSSTTIINWMKKYDIPRRNKSESHLILGVKKSSKEQLNEMYVKKRMSIYKIADELNVTATTICNWLRNYKIKRKGWRDLDYAIEKTEEFLKEHPKYKELPSSRILDKLGYSSLSSGIKEYHKGIPKFRKEIAKLKNIESEVSSTGKKSSDNFNMKKSNIEDKFEKFDKELEQMRREEYLNTCKSIYEEITSKLNNEQLKSFALNLENILNNEILEIEKPIKEERPKISREDVAETRKVTYGINPKIREFYQEKGILIRGKKSKLIIETLLNLTKKGESLTLENLSNFLNQDIHNVASQLDYIKKKEIISRVNHKWKLNDYVELMKYLSSVPREYINKIFNRTYDIKDQIEAIDNGVDKEDIKEIFILAGRGKDYRGIAVGASKHGAYLDRRQQIKLDKDNKMPSITTDEKGQSYYTDLEKHIEDMRNKDEL